MRTMNNLLRLVLVAVLLCVGMTTMCFADEGVVFTFELNDAGDGYALTGYSGDEASITVPDWYMGKPVTSIGKSAFEGNTVITDVALPSCITRIGVAGFKNCTSLTTITTYDASATPERLAGDADDNGVVDANDALLVIKVSSGEDLMINVSNADVDADGEATLADALILMQYNAGWEIELK